MALSRCAAISFLICYSLCLSSSYSKVTVSVYYETLCPYCSDFMVNYLPKIFHNGLISIVDLHLVPYGNARVASNGSISCQHGEDECLLNTVEACAINSWPDVHQHYRFIYCIEELVFEDNYTDWETCFRTTGMDSQPIADCYNSGRGHQIELQYAAETDALQPPNTFVPWVLVNNEPLVNDYKNFEAYICKAYNGELPKACEELVAASPRSMKEKQENDEVKISMLL